VRNVSAAEPRVSAIEASSVSYYAALGTAVEVDIDDAVLAARLAVLLAPLRSPDRAHMAQHATGKARLRLVGNELERASRTTTPR
jgi:hypothetical protein